MTLTPQYSRSATLAPPPVSVVILTLDEGVNIADCLASCQWCDDIHVIDSGSTDDTCRIVRECGAHVHHNRFVSFGQQRNWAIDNVPTRHAWQFHLDADERFTPELVREMAAELGPRGHHASADAFLLRRKTMFMGKWLKFCGGLTRYQARLIHRERCRFVDFGNGQRELCRGPVMRLVNPYIHVEFSKRLRHWLAKQNAYGDATALEAVAARASRGMPGISELRSRDPRIARAARNRLVYRLPARGLLRFADIFLRRGGWLDGTAGFHYAAMFAMTEYWGRLKILEREVGWRRATDELAERLLRESP